MITEFSKNHSTQEFTITPLGAAIVEALPDQRKKSRIVRAFKVRSVCPSSAIFDKSAVEQFYRDRGQQIRGIGLGCDEGFSR